MAETADKPLIVMPTGSGKSLVIAQFICDVIRCDSKIRVAVITHVKELIAQDYRALKSLWPDAPVGILSAGLGRYEVNAKILLGSIHSSYKRAEAIGRRNFVLIDEAHLISRDEGSMYRRFLNAMCNLNSKTGIIGLTATPFRLDSGKLYEGDDRLFTNILHQVPLLSLVKYDYLVPVTAKLPQTTIDVSGVGKRGGEFIPGQLEAAADRAPLTEKIVAEIMTAGAERGSWLIFCSGVAHAEHVRDAIRKRGISGETVTADTPDAERDAIVTDFKNGDIRALTNVGCFTTGFDAPGVDLIAMLRPTCSPGQYVQMIGRGMRLASGKENCLVLDFAGNVARHGPADTVDGFRKLGDGDGVAPTKVCPACSSIVHAAVRECPDCGYEFKPPEPKLTPKPAVEALLSSDARGAWYPVRHVSYGPHFKPGRPVSLRVKYDCVGGPSVSEWICLQHGGYPRQVAERWWRRHRALLPVPATVDAALRRVAELPAPREIRVVRQGKYPQIFDYKFNNLP
jgi:DNA repair protein RadD